MAYSVWNDRLLRYFFGSFASNEQIRLTLTKDLLDSEFGDLGGYESFKFAVRSGPEWPIFRGDWEYSSDTFANTCIGLYQQWKGQHPRHEDYIDQYGEEDGPPYFNYLCALCLAWTLETKEFSDSNFYGRLSQIYPDHSLNQALGKLSHLWEGLEKWTELHDGELGWFNVERLGNHAHVGLPKSQVILTPGKVDRTPGLFYDLSLSPDDELTEGKLRHKILASFDDGNFLLGKDIYQNIKQESGLGLSALKQLLEHFEEWDGLSPVRLQSSNGRSSITNGESSVEGCAAIVAGLEYISDLKSWDPVRIPIMPQTPDGDLYLNKNGSTFKSRLRMGTGSQFVDELDSRSVLRFADLEEDRYIPLTWKSQYEGDREIVVAINRPRSIACFSWNADNTILVQLSSLPSEGNCYCLVNEEVEENFVRWCDKAEVTVEFSNIPQNGLGSASKLYWIDKIGNASAERWAMFPDGGDGKRRRPRRMTLVGGSRQRRERATRTYLPFDPPLLKVEAENVSVADLECENCSLTEIAMENPGMADWIKVASSSRFFEIQPDSSATRVSITLLRGGEPLGRPVAFRLLDREEFQSVSIEKFITNQLGLREQDDFSEGVCGAVAPYQGNFEFQEWRFASWPDCDTNDSSVANVLLDWLASRTSVTYTTLRNFVGRRLASELRRTDLASEVRALYNLGHIEIQIDQRGRWSHIHGAPVVLYPVPCLEDGKYQYVLSGAYSTADVKKVEAECNLQSLGFDRYPQLGGNSRGHWLIPNRVSVIADDTNDVVNLGRKLNIKVIDEPPAWSIANWCWGLDCWYEQLTWHSGAMPQAEASYRPLQYRTMSPKKWPNDVRTNFNLVRSIDPQTKKHFNYSLVKKSEDEFSHAICGHKNWGTWYTHRHMMLSQFRYLEDEGIPLPYDDVNKTLYLPYELDPPPLMSKALTLCSGLASLRVGPDDGQHLRSEFGLENYKGQCVAYQSVPYNIADVALNKLGAKSQAFYRNN